MTEIGDILTERAGSTPMYYLDELVDHLMAEFGYTHQQALRHIITGQIRLAKERSWRYSRPLAQAAFNAYFKTIDAP